jgi:hypothetical protein
MSAVELAGPSATVADKLPALIAGAGERAIDYFVVNIRHRNTRAAVRVNSQRSPHLRRECRTDDGMGISAVVVSLSAKHAMPNEWTSQPRKQAHQEPTGAASAGILRVQPEASARTSPAPAPKRTGRKQRQATRREVQGLEDRVLNPAVHGYCKVCLTSGCRVLKA